MSFKGFQSDRLLMIPIQRSLARSLWPVLQDSALYRYLPQEPPTLETLEKRFTLWATGMSPDKSEYWLNWVLTEKENEQMIGTIQAGILRESKVATIAYMLGSKFQRQGYAIESLSALIEFLKEEYQVVEIKAWIDTRNVASIKLIEKLDLKRIELIEKADFFKGADSDEFVYSLEI